MPAPRKAFPASFAFQPSPGCLSYLDLTAEMDDNPARTLYLERAGRAFPGRDPATLIGEAAMTSEGGFENRLKKDLLKGRKTAGAWAQLASALAVEILARAGFDWLLIDLEHGPGDIPTLVSQLQAMNGSPAVPIVRAPWNDFVVIKRILDAGAQGVLIPYVNTKAEARQAVAACKYPPQGIRGLAGGTRAAAFGQNKDYFAQADQEILVIIQVETGQAVENIDELLEAPGVDGIFIGPMDLATNLGHISDPSQPEVQQAIARVEAKVLKSDKFLGTISKDWAQAKGLFEKGYRFVSLLSDGMGLANLAAATLADFRQAFPSS